MAACSSFSGSPVVCNCGKLAPTTIARRGPHPQLRADALGLAMTPRVYVCPALWPRRRAVWPMELSSLSLSLSVIYLMLTQHDDTLLIHAVNFWRLFDSRSCQHQVWPQLLPLSNGALTLATGRPGITFWTSPGATADCWDYTDVIAEHNKLVCHLGACQM